MTQHNDPFGGAPTDRPGPRPDADPEYALRDRSRLASGWRTFVAWALWILSLPVIAVVTTRAAPDDGITPVAQLVPFFPYAVAAAVPLAVLAVTGRRYLLSLVMIVCVALGGFVAAKAFIAADQQIVHADPAAPGTLRVMTLNASYGQADAEWVSDVVRAEGVEVLAVQELTPQFDEAMRAAGIGELLPHQVTGGAAPGSAAGSGLYSALPLTDAQEGTEMSTFAMPSAVVDAGGQDVLIRCVHPVPPMPGNTGTWQRELREIGATAHAEERSQIVLGDFNATHEHATFRELLGDRFHDAWRLTGAGLERTWPEGLDLPLIGTRVPALFQLDHVVVDDSMRVADIRSQIAPGTDHRAVLATIIT